MTQSFPVRDQPVLQHDLTFSLVWSALPLFPLHVSSLFPVLFVPSTLHICLL